jgi:hypothetical protein
MSFISIVLRSAFLLSAIPALAAAPAEHLKFKRIHDEWVHLQETNASSTSSQLVIDPRVRAMWIENNGVAQDGFSAPLPPGVEWSAFYISNRGIAECAFPVRLSHSQKAREKDSASEQMWICGSSPNQSWQLSFSARGTAREFHIGSGSAIDLVTLRMPAISEAMKADNGLTHGFLDRRTIRIHEPRESVQAIGLEIRLVRDK